VGIEGRYDFTKEWDLGLRGSLLHTWATRQFAYSYGPSVGYNVMENAWISLGYNLSGFKDRDFSVADYTAEGPYVKFRFKFDQNSVKEGLKKLGQ
jgi:opacity protein-like surface antigen